MLYIPIAPPGAGKSHLVRQMINEGMITWEAVVSPDEMRKILTGDISDQSSNNAVFEICDRITSVRLKNGLDVFVDATNLRGRHLYVAGIARAYDQPVTFIAFPPLSATELFDRCEQRGRPIPLDAIGRMVLEMENFDWGVLAGERVVTAETLLRS